MNILGIETSCDETAVAIYGDRGLLAQQLYSQISLHQQFGGVVPELASRDHVKRLLPMIETVLKDANLSLKNLEGIAYTHTPGLIGALLVGSAVAKSLAFSLQIPVLGVHHLESHLMAVFLDQKKPEYPFLALLVSGGHTMLFVVKAFGEYELLGETVDDAAGEAFDKTAKLLGLPYLPGGPALAKRAAQGDPKRFHFPRPMLHQKNFNFSFSGLKTHVREFVQKYPNQDEQFISDVAAAFQEAVIDTLITKCKRALDWTRSEQLVVVGGVSANQCLRNALETLVEEKNINVFYPALEWCTDNAAMVAYTGWIRMKRGERDANWAIQSLARSRLM